MKPEYLSLITGFLGAILGAVVSLASVWLQQRAQEKRDSARLALDAAVKEYESAEEYAKFMAQSGQRTVTYDLGYYIILPTKLAEHLATGSTLTKESWVAAHAKALEISGAAVKFHQERKLQQTSADS